MRCLVMPYWMAAAGAGIGVVAGLIGAGPSILTVLLLSHVGGLPIRSAMTTSLVVVAVMSLVALVPYARAGEVRWRAAVDFGLASMAGAYLSGHAATLIPPRGLLVIFLISMVVAAVAMLWKRPPPEEGAPCSRLRNFVVLAAGGLVVGSLTGLVGLGGGFAVVPLLVVFARAPVRSAVGTSILVIAMNTLAGLAGHLPHVAVDWHAAAYLGAAESAGGLLGGRMAKHVSGAALCRAFACLMLAAAVAMLGNALLR
jgi:uncharacterized membrane protein YfcA